LAEFHDGNISVPYAGLVRAAGRTNGEIQQDIVKKIANRGDGNSLGMARRRMEFLIDRFGYIRQA